MRVRCKMVLNTVTMRMGQKPLYDAAGKHCGYEDRILYDAAFSAVYSDKKDDENKAFWDATPSGKFEVATVIQMPWEIGKAYYIDVTPVEIVQHPGA